MKRRSVQVVGFVVVIVAFVAAITAAVWTTRPDDRWRVNDPEVVWTPKSRFELVSATASTVPCVGGAQTLRCAIASWMACTNAVWLPACDAIQLPSSPSALAFFGYEPEYEPEEQQRTLTAYAVIEQSMVVPRARMRIDKLEPWFEKPRAGDVEVTLKLCWMKPDLERYFCPRACFRECRFFPPWWPLGISRLGTPYRRMVLHLRYASRGRGRLTGRPDRSSETCHPTSAWFRSRPSSPRL